VTRALTLLVIVLALVAAALDHDRDRNQLLIDQSTSSTVASVRLCEPPADPDQLLPKPDDLHPFHQRQGGEA
jgi:hypothetical protein